MFLNSRFLISVLLVACLGYADAEGGLYGELYMTNDCSGVVFKKMMMISADNTCTVTTKNSPGTLLSCNSKTANIATTTSCPLTKTSFTALSKFQLGVCVSFGDTSLKYSCSTYQSSLVIPSDILSMQNTEVPMMNLYPDSTCASTPTQTSLSLALGCSSATESGCQAVADSKSYSEATCVLMPDFYSDAQGIPVSYSISNTFMKYWPYITAFLGAFVVLIGIIIFCCKPKI